MTDEVLARYEDGAGGWVEILERGDEAAPCRYRMRQSPGVGPPAAEYHPAQRETFEVLEGVLELGLIEGAPVRVAAGERYELAAGVPHLPAAGGGEAAVYEAALYPGLEMAKVFEALFRAEREHKGPGKVLRIARTLQVYSGTMRLVQPFATIMKGMSGVARLLGIAPLVVLLAVSGACKTAEPVVDQPPAADVQDTSALGPAAREWAAAPQPAAMIAFFKGTFDTLGVELDTGESFTVKHTGRAFEFLPGVEGADFTVPLTEAQIDNVVRYASDDQVDDDEATAIMAALFIPLTQQILNHPITRDPDLREKSGIETHIHTYLLDPAGQEVASHTMRYQDERWTVTPGIAGEAQRVFRVNASQAAEYQRRAFQAMKTNSPLGWLEFVNWYRAWRETCSTVPGA